MNHLSHDVGNRPGGCGGESGWKSLYRDWANELHDMVEAWALQRGVDLVVSSSQETDQGPPSESLRRTQGIDRTSNRESSGCIVVFGGPG